LADFPSLFQTKYLSCSSQRCGSGSFWEPGSESASNKTQDPDPHQSGKLNPDPHQFANDKPKFMEYEPILPFFKGLSLYLEARIRDPDPVEKSDQDPH
jgi:hypothetical protein